MSLNYVCALCGETVAKGAIDPVAVILVAGWLGPEDDQREQQFTAHSACLRAAMHPDVRDVAEVLDAR